MDEKIFNKMFAFAQKNRRFGSAAVLLTKASSKIFFMIYIAVLYSLRRRADMLAAAIVLPFAALCASYILRRTIKRPRPHSAAAKKSYSFPSNHSTSAAVIACACLYSQSYTGIPIALIAAVFALAFLTGLSRIFAGVHYPSDVAIGWILGLGFGIALVGV